MNRPVMLYHVLVHVCIFKVAVAGMYARHVNNFENVCIETDKSCTVQELIALAHAINGCGDDALTSVDFCCAVNKSAKFTRFPFWHLRLTTLFC